MDREKLIDRVRRLLRLAESANVHEAASAAARAQELMARHRIEAASLDTGGDDDVRDHRDAPLDASKRLRPWKTHLADAIARANGCRIYLHTRGNVRAIVLVGRAEDVSLVRMLFEELVKRVESMTRKHGAGRERSFCNAFRIGMVVTIGERLEAASRDARAHALERGEANDDETPLSQEATTLALARLDAREHAVERFMDETLKLERGRSKGIRADAEGYALGRIIGHQVALAAGSQNPLEK